jgi:energy-coupling factor transport system ATP-binding protein
MPTLLSKLRLALGLALGFLLFRLAYAVVFTGASSGNTLLDFPGLPLGGIFSHVVLFGSVGDQGLLNALLSAIPFSLAILAFGLLSILVTPAKIMAIASKSQSGLLAALSIGLATMPSLLEASRRIVAANKMRSESKSSILVPLLETALERAVSVGIRFATAPRKTTALNDKVSIDGFGMKLELCPGDVLVVSGATGSGKTTLLETLVGINQLRTGRPPSSQVLVFGRDPSSDLASVSGLIGYVPQQPRSWFVADRVSDELNTPRLPWAHFEAEGLNHLSEGQVIKLAISNAFAHDPKLIVMDEPFAALDGESKLELNRMISAWSQEGRIVVVAEHEPDSIDHPRVKHAHFNPNLQPGSYRPESVFVARKIPVVGSELLIDYQVPRIRDLALPARVEIHQGERIALVGPNGIGKTSLLNQLAADYPSARMVPERVEDFFVCQSVEEELKRADRTASATAGLTQLTLESLIPVTQKLLETHPRDLSAGSKLALAIAMQLSFKPTLLLVDEPVKGLDPLARERVSEVLACVAETGCAILFATHDENFAVCADKRIELSAVKQ